jgi:D-glycero-D-manno-heptose 1,7-bisphosphate phosphatase
MRLVILDRDGVINRDSDEYIKSAAEFIPLPGSIEAIARLSAAGYTVAVASNQSGIGRGLFSRSALYGMHRKLRRLVRAAGGAIGKIAYCPHAPNDGCECRKPRAALLRRIGAHYGCSLDGVPVIGDSLRDLQAAVAVGARPVLVLTGKGRATERQLAQSGIRAEVFDDLSGAVDALLKTTRR